MPVLHYWFSQPALFLFLSFVLTVIIGVVPMIDGKRRGFLSVLILLALIIAGMGWWSAAQQQENADKQVKRLQQFIDGMNRALNISRPPAIDADAPGWLKYAYNELGEREIPGPKENPRITEYFKSIGAKSNYRDDLDDWASAFVEWSFNQVGIAGPKNDDPYAWLQWGKKLKNPLVGCVVVMSFAGLSHVGLYFGADNGFVLVLGGNEDDAVNIFHYPASAVLDYRWPPGVKLSANTR